MFHQHPTLCQEALAGHKNIKGVCASFRVYEGWRQVSSRSWRVNGVGEMRINMERTRFPRDTGGDPLPVLPGGNSHPQRQWWGSPLSVLPGGTLVLRDSNGGPLPVLPGGNLCPQRQWGGPLPVLPGGCPLPVLPGGSPCPQRQWWGVLFLSFLGEALFLSFLVGALFLSFLVGTLFLFFLSLGVTPSWQNLKA